MLWLKRFDRISLAYPRSLSRNRRAPNTELPIILRPGGLGDMVLLTRAAGEAGLDLSQLLWIGERRNISWTSYLGLPALAYDSIPVFLRGVGGSPRSRVVINTEQTFGLAAVFASRLTAEGGVLAGFDSNIRADLHDRNVRYEHDRHELGSFVDLLEAGGLSGETPQRRLPDRAPGAGTHDGAAVIAFAGRESAVKSLSAAAWRAIVKLAAGSASTVVAVGTPSDRAFSEEVLTGRGGAAVENLVGKLSFAEVVDLVRGAARVVSVDSGLVHVADYCGVPADVIFPGGNPKKWQPLHPQGRVIEADESVLTDPLAFSRLV